MTRHNRLDALLVATSATILAAAVGVLGPQPSHADDQTRTTGFPNSTQCPDSSLSSRLALRSAVIDHPLIQLAHQRIAKLEQQVQALTRWIGDTHTLRAVSTAS